MRKKYFTFIVCIFLFIAAKSQIITTIAGGGTDTTDNGILATNAYFNTPVGVFVDKKGYVYITDEVSRVTKVSPTGTITTIAGTGTNGYSGDGGPATAAEINLPMGIYVDAIGNIYIGSTQDYRIRKVDTSGIISTIAGNGTLGYTGDSGLATSAVIGGAQGITGDAAGNIYFTDFYFGVVRKINTAGIISTIAGVGNQGYSGDGGLATAAELGAPNSVSIDAAGNIYIGDDYPVNVVRKINSSGIISTVAGSVIDSAYKGYDSEDGGPATSALFNDIECAFADNAGNIFIADESSDSTGNNKIRKVNTAGIISTVAGNGTLGFSGDGGLATSSQLNEPWAVFADQYGDFYIADSRNQRIRKVTEPDTSIKTGNWNNPTIWSKGKAPDSSTQVVINSPVTINANAFAYSLSDPNDMLTIDSGISITIKVWTSYEFDGSGSWNNSTDWFNNQEAPRNISGGTIVIIDPTNPVDCIDTGNITIHAPAILQVDSAKTLDIVNSGLTNTGVLLGPGKIVFSGSSTTLSSSGTISAPLHLSNDTAYLTGNTNTTDSIILSNGSFIVLDSFNLNMGSGYLQGDSGNYIITNSTGSLIRTIADSTTTPFYVGPNSSSFSPLIISNPTITGNGDTSNFSVRVDSGVYVYGGPNDSIVNTIDTGNVNLTWIISSNAPVGSTSTVTLGWCTSDEQKGFSPHLLKGLSTNSRCVTPNCNDSYTNILHANTIPQVSTPISPSCANTITQTGVPLIPDTLVIGSSSVYVFSGSGDIDSANNWVNGAMPPDVIDSGEVVIINCSGTCTYNGDITVMPGGILQVVGGELKIAGQLIIEQ
jgi:hypothetical protein